ncbi:hypothetical protein GCM10007916_22870 [Psychromonas marina]|uniref:DUF423 domain-containing protein n=1 Tax=Psychromonas marina TaxID=88364 RepID=A0ABQ6E1E8_9GAMM|nr:DUF423 domain-containing protein [Psychromonas marina]GLS91218.1 hypothetical protein GCM10007916_22870 [Psychromonas marina]
MTQSNSNSIKHNSKIGLSFSSRLFLVIAALLGATGVALGAYASHGLASWATTQQVEYFQLAVTYQLLHAITLLAVSIGGLFFNNRYLFISQIMFVLGICFFSGSLYLYVFTGTKVLGMITPIGGLLLIIAWLMFAVSIIRNSSKC